MAGELYVVATPIGNLEDMVPRAVSVLQQADLIAAEDTRHSGRLLNHFAINTPMVAYHEHGDSHQRQRIIAALERGETVALISDAGTPLISDPGYRLVHEVRQQGFNVIPVPGACALIAALCASGLPSDRFAFEGFLPHKTGARVKRLEALRAESATLIFYESPHRIAETLADMVAVFGSGRQAVMARELTKAFETFLSGPLSEILDSVLADANQQKGEIVILLHGADDQAADADQSEQERVLRLLMAELPLKQAAKLAAQITGGAKNTLYQRALTIRDQ